MPAPSAGGGAMSLAEGRGRAKPGATSLDGGATSLDGDGNHPPQAPEARQSLIAKKFCLVINFEPFQECFKLLFVGNLLVMNFLILDVLYQAIDSSYINSK